MNTSQSLSEKSDFPFDPLEFYRLADHLLQSPSEAAYRTAISRAYYAVFLTIANTPAIQRVMPAASYGEGSHIDVIHAVRRLHKYTIAVRLGELKELRGLADYNLVPNELFRDWAKNWNDAQNLTEWLIAALPSLHNARR